MSSSKAVDQPQKSDTARSAPQTFVPRRFLRNGHLQTIFGNFLPRTNALPASVEELVEVCPASATQIATQILCLCHWQPAEVRSQRPTAIIVHGLEGSADSQYVVGNANKLWRAGANVIRMNMRNCGGRNYEMARRTPTLYHSGLSGDVNAVMRHFLIRERLQSITLIGYSMGGNLVLKLAGELGADAPAQLRSAIGVSPAVDLGASATALHRPENRLYERRFLRNLLKRFRHKVRLFPRAFDPRPRKRHTVPARLRRSHHCALLWLRLRRGLLLPSSRRACHRSHRDSHTHHPGARRPLRHDYARDHGQHRGQPKHHLGADRARRPLRLPGSA